MQRPSARTGQPPAAAWRAVAALAVAVLGATILLRAQDQDGLPVFRGGVEVVYVDVSVLNRDRRPIRGLTARDFTILDEGQLRPVVAFNAIDLPLRAAAPRDLAAWTREIPLDSATNVRPAEGRLLTIMFDRSIRLQDQAIARRVATRAIDEMQPGDLASIVFTSAFVKAGTVQGFTSDRGMLLEAIRRPIVPAMPRRIEDPVQGEDGIEDGGEDCGLCSTCSFEKVEHVARAVQDIPTRRKSILLVAVTQPDPSPPPSPCAAEVQRARMAAERALALANVTVHVVSPAGVEPLETSITRGRGYGSSPGPNPGANRGPLSNTAFYRLGPLPFFAYLTGGRFVVEDNAPEREVQDIVGESAAYYVLAFEPADPSRRDGRLRRIEVNVNRRDTTVLARKSYRLGDAPDAADPTSSSPVVEAIRPTLPRTDLQLRLTAMPFAAAGEGSPTVALALQATGGPDLQTVARPASPDQRDTVRVTFAVIDPVSGRVVDVVQHSGAVAWPTASTGWGEQEFVSQLTVPPGRFEVRAAVERTSGAHGTVHGVVEVPRFASEPLTLSGIAVQARTAGAAPAAGDLDVLKSFVPTARRVFRATEVVTAFARVYQAGAAGQAAPPAVVARVQDATGAAKFELRPVLRAGDIQIDLPLSRFAPGEHLLTIEARSGTAVAARHVRFTVE